MKKMFQIGQFAEFAGVSRRTLRNYDDLDILKPEKIDSDSGYRLYSKKQIHQVNLILLLQEMNISLRQIRKILQEGISEEQFLLLLKDQEAALRIAIDKQTKASMRIKMLIDYMETAPGSIHNTKTYFQSINTGDLKLNRHRDKRSYIVSEPTLSYNSGNFKCYHPDQFPEMIDRWISTHNNPRKQFCYITLDIDRFLRVNDQYGIPAGDKVILSIKKIIENVFDDFNEAGFFGRSGGDEYAIFLHHKEKEIVHQKVAKLLKIAEESEIAIDDTVIKITLSAGVYWTDQKESYKELQHNSTKALLDAKRAGRNQWRGIAYSEAYAKLPEDESSDR